jgi:hypothetical protein
MEKRRALWFAIPILLIVTLFTLFACCCPGNRPGTVAIAPTPVPLIGQAEMPVPIEAVPAPATDAEMRNVDFRVDPNLVLHIHDLRGQMLDKEAGKPLNFDNKKSFIVRLFNAHIGVDGQTLTNLLNGYVFNYSGSPLKNLTASIAGGHLVLEGTMHKVIDIPFRMISDVSTTKDGWMRVHPTKIEICNLNGEGLMKAFGITLQKVLTKLPAGVRVEKNDMLLDPLAILPPPKIEGHLGAVAIEGDELVQIFDDGRGIPPLQPPEPTAKNFMYFQHGTLRIGKLFMVSADMQVIDTDPSDPFDFYIDRYNSQLVAGYDRNRPDYGLTVYMRDASDVGKPPRPGEHLAP